MFASGSSSTVVNQPLLSLIGGSVEVLKSFLEIMGSSATGQTTAAIRQEPVPPPERWIQLDQFSTKGNTVCKSGIEENDLSHDQTYRDSAVERLMNSITQKLTVDCPQLLRAGEIALKNARFSSSEKLLVTSYESIQ